MGEDLQAVDIRVAMVYDGKQACSDREKTKWKWYRNGDGEAERETEKRWHADREKWERGHNGRESNESNWKRGIGKRLYETQLMNDSAMAFCFTTRYISLRRPRRNTGALYYSSSAVMFGDAQECERASRERRRGRGMQYLWRVVYLEIDDAKVQSKSAFETEIPVDIQFILSLVSTYRCSECTCPIVDSSSARIYCAFSVQQAMTVCVCLCLVMTCKLSADCSGEIRHLRPVISSSIIMWMPIAEWHNSSAIVALKLAILHA